MNGRNKSFEIALSAIACAIAVAFLWLGILSGFLTALGYLVGVVALMLPLSKQFYLGGFLAYVGTCILTLILGAVAQFWSLVPFIMFFGLHPLANALQLKYKVNTWLALAIKAVWFIGTLFAGYYLVFGGILGGTFLPESFFEVVNKYIFIFIPVFGALFIFVYDYLIFRCQMAVNALVHRIRK